MEKANNKEALNLNNNYKYITPYTLGLVMASPTNCPIRIGDLLISTMSRNPSEDYVGTEWVYFGQGRTLVGVDTSQTEFNSVLKTGGHKALQAHNHAIKGGGVGVGVNHSYAETTAFGGQKTVTNYMYTEPSGSGNSGNLQPYICVYMWKRIK